MASLVGGALQTTFAALSFAGAGFLFQKLNKNGYEAEMERHNRALEDLEKAKELFYENEVKERDGIQKLRQEISDANADINWMNKALIQYGKVRKQQEKQKEWRELRTIHFNGRKFSRRPTFNDFYTPSPEMKEYQTLVAGAIGLGVGYLAYRFI